MLLQEVGKRLRDLREVLNEPSRIACEPKEATELLHVLRWFPIHNCRHLLRINSYALGGDDMPKVENLIETKLALSKLRIELMFSEFVQHQSQVLGMILLVLGKDQDVIEIHQDEIICVWVEDEVHHARECWRSIDKAERHDNIFIRTIACSECCLGDIFFTNVNLMITHMEVKLGEHLCTFKLLE